MTATTSPNPAEGPLAGLRVLEMGSTVAGPFCGRLLADFGAEVVKIEDPAGDPVRTMGKRFHGKSLYAASIFRNKALLALDLRQTRGREIARDMAQRADVLIENFRPGSLESWGLGYEQLSAVNRSTSFTWIASSRERIAISFRSSRASCRNRERSL